MATFTSTPRDAALASAATTSESPISSFSTRREDFAPLIMPSSALCALVGLHTRLSPFGGVIAALTKSAANTVSIAATSATSVVNTAKSRLVL